jgi:hypothetical protein
MLEDSPSLRPFALALLARALEGQGRNAQALSFAREAYAQLEATGEVQDGEATIRLAFAECLIASPEPEAAKQAVRDAVKRLRKLASTIDDPNWRESFLNRIPEHRRILELGRELGICTCS